MIPPLDPLRLHAGMERWGMGLLLAALLLAIGYRCGADRWREKYNGEVAARTADNATHAALLRQMAEATAAAAGRARTASNALAEARRENDIRYEEALKDADSARRGLAAALHRGTVRLRPEWDCTAPGAGSGAAADAAAGQDEAAGLRATGAEDLVAAADRADAWIGWLQRELIDTRRAMLQAACAIEGSTSSRTGRGSL